MKFPKDKEQLKIIDKIYTHFKEKDKWVGVRTLHSEFDRKSIGKLIKKYPYLIQQIYEPEGEVYKLMPAGFYYYLEKETENKKLLQNYLDFLIQKFKENPEMKGISSQKIQIELDLKEEELNKLKGIIKTLDIYSSAMWAVNGTWEVSFPSDIEDLVELRNPEKYMEKRINEEIKREKQFKKKEIF